MSYQIPWSLMNLQICGKMMIEAAKFGPRCYRPFLQYSFSGRKIFRIRHLISDLGIPDKGLDPLQSLLTRLDGAV